ncbi:MAG: methyltransferase domain-containing protein, partial [Chloroflexota bacterium]
GHMQQYAKYAPIDRDAAVVEVGCGVGRDAIQLAEHLSERGSYVGIDIIRPSIEWCRANIAARRPNFSFHHIDIESQLHNAAGTARVTDVRLPVRSKSADRILLQSVFTHMFFGDIVHYLREFRRILKPEGKVVASFFLIDDEARRAIDAGVGDPAFKLTFRFPRGRGCWINDEMYPEGAVAYSFEALDEMLADAGMALDQPVHRGHWFGRMELPDGQDMAVLKRGRRRLLPKLPRVTIGW